MKKRSKVCSLRISSVKALSTTNVCSDKVKIIVNWNWFQIELTQNTLDANARNVTWLIVRPNILVYEDRASIRRNDKITWAEIS